MYHRCLEDCCARILRNTVFVRTGTSVPPVRRSPPPAPPATSLRVVFERAQLQLSAPSVLRLNPCFTAVSARGEEGGVSFQKIYDM